MITLSHINSFAPSLSAIEKQQLINAMSVAKDKFKINSELRVKHFIAQTLHETGGYKIKIEKGNAAYFKKYEGRKDLGNIYPGDGYKFRGRGAIQITGRSNYTNASKAIFNDNRLVNSPDLVVSDMYTSILIGAWWWYNTARSANYFPDGKANFFADQDNARMVSQIVNVGPFGDLKQFINRVPNGLVERLKYTKQIANVLKSIPIKIISNPFSWLFSSFAISGIFFFNLS